MESFLKENKTHQENKSPSLRTTFRCKFEDVSNGEYVYDVFWFINDNNVTVHHNIPFNNIDRTDLLDREWEDNYNMNMKVTTENYIYFYRYKS